MRKHWKKYITMITICTIIFTGCSSSQTSQTADEATASASASASADATSSTLLTSSEVQVDTEFSAKDLEVGYEDSTANYITLEQGNITSTSNDGVTIKDNTLTITQEGTYVLNGTLTDGQIIIDAGDSDKIQLILNGVDITCSTNAPIYIKNADKVFITLEQDTENNLTDSSEYVQTDDTTVDGVIFSEADLTLNGEGTLNITGNYKHGIASKDDLIITGGIYNITAVKDGLNGKDCVKIKDGTFHISVTDGNGIQSKNGDDSTKGYVYICGGTIDIEKCQEGIEGTVILIEDGTISITAQDDGLNAASKISTDTNDTSTDTSLTANNESTDNTTIQTDTSTESTENNKPFNKNDNMGGGMGGENENNTNCFISITGGTLIVNAAGDGIDSNGSLEISGGTITINGPSDSGNGALDYNGTADITGGTIIAIGSSGMAQGFSDSSTQYSLLCNLTTACEANTEITLTDSDGNTIISSTASKQFQSVVISTPDLKDGETYSLTCGSESTDITLSAITTTSGEQSMGGGGHGFGGSGDKQQMQDSPDGNAPASPTDNGTSSDTNDSTTDSTTSQS